MKQDRTVLFVCEHGSAKSVVAAAYFNRLAMARQAGLRAVSRGTNPDDEIAPGAARGLAGDGLDISGEVPRLLAAGEVEAAVRVVAFCPLPKEHSESRAIETWHDIPPVSDDYERARDAIAVRVGRLLDELTEPAAKERVP